MSGEKEQKANDPVRRKKNTMPTNESVRLDPIDESGKRAGKGKK